MAKSSLLDYSTTPDNNTDIGGIGIQGTSAVNNFDNAFRTLMAQMRQDLDFKQVYAAKTGNYTAVANDNNAVLRFNAAYTLSLTAAPTLGANWHIQVRADGGAITIDPNASETINGADTLVVPRGATATVICDGTQFFASLDDKTVLNSKSADYTAISADNGSTIRFTAAATLSLTASATLGANWRVTIRAEGADVTIDPNGVEQINGAATLKVLDGSTVDIICSGTAFYATTAFQTKAAINKFSAGYEPIGDVIDLTNVSQVDWINLSEFTELYLEVTARGGNPSASTGLYARVSTDNGATFLSNASDYSWTGFSQEGVASSPTAEAAATLIVLSRESAAVGSLFKATLSIGGFNHSSQTIWQGSNKYLKSGGALRMDDLYGYINPVTARNALRFFCLGGALQYGKAQLFGIRG